MVFEVLTFKNSDYLQDGQLQNRKKKKKRFKFKFCFLFLKEIILGASMLKFQFRYFYQYMAHVHCPVFCSNCRNGIFCMIYQITCLICFLTSLRLRCTKNTWSNFTKSTHLLLANMVDLQIYFGEQEVRQLANKKISILLKLK